MESKKQIEVRVCDFCKSSDQCYQKCACCGKDVCYDCRKKVGIEYEHSTSCSGSGDGFYCHDCDQKDKSELHSAFVLIRSLRLEWTGFYADYRRRSEEVEKRLAQLQRP